ncbi:MAG: T9SS type A sorting domain-containing protein [Ignavibacteria bacterium]|nr:T9SS type A sorting domain-containing protein [Ignavibacteria bacterium]
MKKLTYFFVVALLVLSTTAHSQWTFVGGVVGAGTSPSISVCSPTCAWIAGGTNTPNIYRTTNGGVNWTVIGTTGLQVKAVWCCWAIDSLTCYVGDGGDAAGQTGGDATLSRTTNGGVSWTAVANTGGTAGFINGVIFSRSNPQFGFAQSDPPGGTGTAYWIKKTTDGGATWTTQNPTAVTGAASAQNGLFMIDGNFYGFGLNAAPSRGRYTTDGGTTWSLATLGITGGFVSGMAFHDNKQLGVATTGDASGSSLPNIARTTNGGSTWSVVNTGAGVTGYGNLEWISNSRTVYLSGGAGTSGTVRKSTDAGATWVTQTTSGLTGITHFDFFRNGSTVWGYAVCSDGSVLKLNETVTGVSEPTNSNVPANYSLEQNYPNPFNPTTTINFSLPKSSDVSLKIYDALGNEVMNIVNEYKEAGTHSVLLNASNLTSGVYFYKLQAGDFISTKKLTLIK